MLAADYPFLDILWTMFIFFLFVIWIWILITVFSDIFRRKDIGGGSKTLWIIFVIVLPYLGVFVYLIANHDGMADRNIQQMQKQQQQTDALHPVRRRKRWRCRRDREGEGPPRLGRDHAGRVRRAQAEGAGVGLTERRVGRRERRLSTRHPRQRESALGSSDVRGRRRPTACRSRSAAAEDPPYRRVDRRHDPRPRRPALAGIDVWGWFEDLWDTLTEISIGYIILGCLFQGLQTMLTALGWYGILRYAYPGGVTYMPVLAAYATGVALNNFVPANMGTFVMLLMYVAIVKGCDVPGCPRRIRRAEDLLLRHRHPHLHLPLQRRRRVVRLPVRQRARRDLEPPRLDARDHRRSDLPPRSPASSLLGLGQEDVGEGGAGRRHPPRPRRVREARAASPDGRLRGEGHGDRRVPRRVRHSGDVRLGDERARLEPAREHPLLHPGGIGVNQAFNTYALGAYTDDTTATAYSLGQQLITTAFNVGFAILLICVVFGWQGGSKLVKDSYADAKVKKDEMGDERREKREAKREARAVGRPPRAHARDPPLGRRSR